MDPSTLSKLYGLDGPFVTLYLDSSSASEGVCAVLRYAV
jgi:hypothetical protein